MPNEATPPDDAASKKQRFYNKYDLVSFLLKSIRCRRKEDAITIFWILLHEGISQYYLAKKLVQYASEDAVGSESFVYAMNVFLLIERVKDETNSISRLILFLCDAPCMWESEKETEWEIRRLNIQQRVERCYERGEKPLELPTWIFDRYTSRGKAKLNKGEKFDRRISGVREGSGLFCRATYLKHGRLDPDDTKPEQAYAPHLLQCAKEGLHVDAYLRKYGVSIDEFLTLS